MTRARLLADDRGQTAQDFAVGIGLFLLAVAFVFGFVPYVISPFDAGVGAAEASQADRAATTVVANLSDPERPNELDASATESYFDGPGSNDLRNRTGLPFTARINVTVTNVTSDTFASRDGSSDEWAAGGEYFERFGGVSSTRIVRTDEPGVCEPVCRLVVRVW